MLGVAIDVDGQTLEGFINGTGYGKFDISSAVVGSGLRVPMIVLYGTGGNGGSPLLLVTHCAECAGPTAGLSAGHESDGLLGLI